MFNIIPVQIKRDCTYGVHGKYRSGDNLERSEVTHELLLAAIAPDDPESFSYEIIDLDEASRLIIRVISKNLNTIRSTIDDILVCLAAANTSLDVVEER